MKKFISLIILVLLATSIYAAPRRKELKASSKQQQIANAIDIIKSGQFVVGYYYNHEYQEPMVGVIFNTANSKFSLISSREDNDGYAMEYTRSYNDRTSHGIIEISKKTGKIRTTHKTRLGANSYDFYSYREVMTIEEYHNKKTAP